MTSQLLPPPPVYEKGRHPDDLLSEGSSLETRAVAAATRRFFGGGRVEVFGPALVFAVRTPCGYLSATSDGRVTCDGVDPASPACTFRVQKGGVAAHFRLTIRSELTGRRLRLEQGTTVSATGGQGDGAAPDEEKWMYFNHEFHEANNVFPGDSMTFCVSRDREVLWTARRPGLLLGAKGSPFYLVDPVAEQRRVDALRAKQAARDKQVADAAAALDLAAKQEYADRVAALRIADQAEAAAARAAADEAAAAAERLGAELDLARKQAEKAKAEAKAARQEAADRIAAAQIAERAALERSAAQQAAAAPAREAPLPPVATAARTSIPNAVYIPNIPDGITAARLKIRFSTYGRVASCVVLPHKYPMKTGHYAFVDFDSIDAAQKAMAAKVVMDGLELQLRIKTVQAAADKLASRADSASAPGTPSPRVRAEFKPRPFPSLDVHRNQVSEHAECLAQQYMAWLGFSDAARVGHINEPDGGIDVSSTHAVAQVKAQWHGTKVQRPVLQAFMGACSVREHMLKGNRLFFAPLYTADAVAYADELNMKLFTFNAAGQVSPENLAAKALLASLGKPV